MIKLRHLFSRTIERTLYPFGGCTMSKDFVAAANALVDSLSHRVQQAFAEEPLQIFGAGLGLLEPV